MTTEMTVVEQMREALTQAEACMSIVEPRSDKAEYLRILGVVRAALSRAEELRSGGQGWRLVPVEPTFEMQVAMMERAIALWEEFGKTSLNLTPIPPYAAVFFSGCEMTAIYKAALAASLPPAPGSE